MLKLLFWQKKNTQAGGIVSMYLYCWITSTRWPRITTKEISGVFYLKLMTIILVFWYIDIQERTQSLKLSTTRPWSVSLSQSRDTINESSANLMTCLPSFRLRHSFAYKTNQSCERTNLLRQPVEDKRTLHITALTLTLWDLCAKKDPTSQHVRPGSMLWVLVSRSAKMWGWTQLKAVEKSIKSSRTKLFVPSKWPKTTLSRVLTASSLLPALLTN